jgi:predicted methyltransferase
VTCTRYRLRLGSGRTLRLLSPLALGVLTVWLVGTGAISVTVAPRAAAAEAQAAAAPRPQDRPASIRTIAARVGIGSGDTIADIGAGRGVDTWVFADIVGPSGTVHAVEITENSVKTLRAEVEKRKVAQVRPVLGRDDSPNLPRDSVDLAYTRYVYHHMSKPREMLREIWRSLKPGGHFVVVDRLPGTLRDWVPREQRASKHFWLAETTVVREAREEGFRFVACADELCEAKDKPFVLILQRPETQAEPGCDPDAFLPLAVSQVSETLLPAGKRLQRPAIIALGQARELIPAILKRSSGAGIEIVLEEWATQKDERPPLPADVSLPSVLTDLGAVDLGSEPIDAVFFLDTYHLLFHGPAARCRRLRLCVGSRGAAGRFAARGQSSPPDRSGDRQAGTGRCRLCSVIRGFAAGRGSFPAGLWQGETGVSWLNSLALRTEP